MGTGDLCWVPPAAVHSERARQYPGTGPCGCRRRALWVLGRGVSIRRKFVLSRNPRGGGRHMAKRSSDPRVSYPEVNVQVRNLVRVVIIVAPFAPRGFSIRRKFVLSYYRFIDRTSQKQYTRSLVYYFQVEGMKYDQELYVKVSYIPSAQSSCRSSMRRELYADL